MLLCWPRGHQHCATAHARKMEPGRLSMPHHVNKSEGDIKHDKLAYKNPFPLDITNSRQHSAGNSQRVLYGVVVSFPLQVLVPSPHGQLFSGELMAPAASHLVVPFLMAPIGRHTLPDDFLSVVARCAGCRILIHAKSSSVTPSCTS